MKNVLIKREKAGQETKKRQRKLDQISYEVQGDDVVILSGPYQGRSVNEMWDIGPIERDYIVNHLWFTNDASVVSIINKLCAN